MLGLFCSVSCTDNEEYRKCIQKRMWLWRGMLAAGILTFIIAFLAGNYWQIELEDFMLGMYQGVGAGLIGASVALLFKNGRLLKDEEKLRRARIAASDERNMEIVSRAMRAALVVLLVAIYFVMLIGGLWYPQIAWVLANLVCLFLLAYVAAYKIIARKM
ncbi:MAG: hypothetical protein J6B10_08195 [Lachnospiraceae bacterium]|nr:hypothetical protein [Lachnospiraceae bacterium]